eukprot:m.57083 g.57083  ORF g.57083 m.57083 type:complete len:60 (+) comp48995_c0_seq1:480-659(+)
MVAARWRHRLRVVRVKQARAASAAAIPVAVNEMDTSSVAVIASFFFFGISHEQSSPPTF